MSVPPPPAPRESQMYLTMHRQPDDLRRIGGGEGWDAAERAARLLAGKRRVFLTGIGTSYHATLVGEWLLRGVGVDARAVMSYDFAAYPDIYPVGGDDAVVVMAHSGVKTYSSQSLARAVAAGATVLSVGSLSAEHPGSELVLRTVEREKSAAFTASHTGAMFVLAQIAARLAANTGHPAATGLRSALDALPDQVAAVLDREGEVAPIAAGAKDRLIYAAGAGPNAATALEAVIKAREAATSQIDGLALEQFLHGPLVTVNADDFGVLVHVRGAAPATTQRTDEIAGVLAGIGTPLWVIGGPASRAPDATVFELPQVPEPISPILAVVPVQMLAQQLAVARGANPDRFRREDPRYAEALSTLTL